MKKSVFSVMAIASLFFTTQVMQGQEKPTEPMEEKTVEEVVETPSTTNQFKVIDVLALPQPGKDATMTEFNAVASNAWVKMDGDQKVYKLDIAADGKTKTLYATQNGEWLKEGEVVDDTELK